MSDSPEMSALFASIARRYDCANAVMSLGLHYLWNRALIREACRNAKGVLLDLCAGTGAIGLGCSRRACWEHLYLLDICKEMLDIAQVKAKHWNVHPTFLQADAQAIPLPDASCDTVVMSYGIRNIPDVVSCAKEVRRVLRPGGRWLILELTRPNSFLLRQLHQLYLRTAVPLLGPLVASNRQAYQYLAQSVSQFTAPSTLLPQLASGFRSTGAHSLCGGVATLMKIER